MQVRTVDAQPGMGYGGAASEARQRAELYDSSCATPTGNDSDSSSSAELGKVYVLGDSITEGAASLYESQMRSAGASDVKVSASGGGNLDNAGSTGTKSSGLDSIAADSDYIKDADTFIMAHGTNNMSHTRDANVVIKEAMAAIKATGTSAKVHWVDVAITDRGPSNYLPVIGAVNKAIHGNTGEGYSVISWAKEVDSEYDPTSDTGFLTHNAEYIGNDGIHLTPAGTGKLVETVVSASKGSGSSSSSSGSTGNACCDETTGAIQLAGDDNIEKTLNFFMQKGLSLAQAAGFVGNMMQESGMRPDIIQGGATADENYRMQNGVGFGLIQWTWTERQAPLQAKADSMNKSIIDIEVQLEYIWDELEAGYKHTLDALKNTDDPVEAAVIVHGPPWPGYEASADTPGFVREVRGGNAQEVYDKYEGMTPSGGSSSSSSANCGQGNKAKVNAEGFTWPADTFDDKDDLVGFPCVSDSFCGHHDQTPAFDIYYNSSFDKAEDRDVYAIRDGSIDRLGIRRGYSHCFDWQLVGDDDWWYWYGHNYQPEVENGESVSAGDVLGKIGPTECADQTPPHLHIDRGYPQGNSGGSKSSRDPGFVPIMQSLWEDI